MQLEKNTGLRTNSGVLQYMFQLNSFLDNKVKDLKMYRKYMRSASPINPFLSNLQIQIYLNRKDLQNEFNIETINGLERFRQWCRNHGTKEYKINKYFFEEDLTEYKILILKSKNSLTGHSMHSQNLENKTKKIFSTKSVDINLSLNFNAYENFGVRPKKQLPKGSVFSFNPSELTRLNQMSKLFFETKEKKILHFAWEIESCNWEDFASLQYIDEIITVSDFSKSAFLPKYDEKIHVVSPIDSDSLKGSNRVLSKKLKNFGLRNKTYYLNVSDTLSCLDRKGILDLIKVYSNLPIVNKKLVLKISSFTGNGLIQKKIMSKVTKNKNIILITETLTETEMESLISNSYAYLSPHKSEGFGISLFQSIVLGVPVLATKYSGNMEYMKGYDKLLIAYDKKNISKIALEVYRKTGAQWAYVKKKDFKEKIRDLDQNYQGYLEATLECRDLILANYNYKINLNILKSVFEKILR